jgi:hypothetical protein
VLRSIMKSRRRIALRRTTLAMFRLQQGFAAGEIGLQADITECSAALNATEQIG